jgi:hypothetical protein
MRVLLEFVNQFAKENHVDARSRYTFLWSLFQARRLNQKVYAKEHKMIGKLGGPLNKP